MDITANRIDPVPGAGILRLVNDAGNLRILDANGKRYRIRPEPGTPVHAVAAAGTLTGTTIGEDDQISIGGTPYQFTSGELLRNYVLLGESESDSLDNLIATIKGDAGEGTLYGTGTVPQTLVTAAAGEGDTMTLAAATAGTTGNSIGTTASLTAGGFAAATLTGGIDATPAQAGDQLYDDDFLYTALADIGPTSTAGWVKSAVATL